MLILKSLLLLTQDEPNLDPPQIAVDRLLTLYADLESEWSDLKSLVADIFASMAFALLNMPREAGWVMSIGFNRQLLTIFLNFNGATSEEHYLLVFKWSLVVASIVLTDPGLRAAQTFQYLLALSKVVFESTFAQPLRIKLAESVVRMVTMQCVPPEFKQLIDAITEVNGIKESLTGDSLVKAIDREVTNPCFIFTRLTAYKNRDRYNKQLRLLISKLDEAATSMSASALEETDLK